MCFDDANFTPSNNVGNCIATLACESGHFGTTKSAPAQIGAKKKNSYAKLIVLRLMVTRYIGNMIVFLRCHYAHLSITITSKLSALNYNKILYYCNCHATISSSVHMFAIFFVSSENKLSH